MKNKNVIKALGAMSCVLCFSACSSGLSNSIAALGAGSDSAALNSTRGRADAQISRGQADQYSRQRQQVSEEMDLEQKKRSNMLNNASTVFGFFN